MFPTIEFYLNIDMITIDTCGNKQLSNKSSYALVSLVPERRLVLTGVTPVTCKKAVKNPVELEGMRRAHVSCFWWGAMCYLDSILAFLPINHHRISDNRP